MYAKKKSVSLKAMAMLLVIVLLIGCGIGGTIAYLATSDGPVTNTFVPGNIGELTLTETTGDNYAVIPGVDIEKDPVVTFKGNTVDAYVFLMVEDTGWTVTANTDTNTNVTTYTYSIGESGKEMSWTLADGWIPLNPEREKGDDYFYYREVAANSGPQTWPVIKNNTITVSPEITQEMISKYATTLKFIAAAAQQADGDGTFTPADAFEINFAGE